MLTNRNFVYHIKGLFCCPDTPVKLELDILPVAMDLHTNSSAYFLISNGKSVGEVLLKVQKRKKKKKAWRWKRETKRFSRVKVVWADKKMLSRLLCCSCSLF
ncbi:hypothetical protein CEXT_354511 [Caerostris extrusa]|uniref:Uncharacterized protein n=1 Tax=Caerostris extrusa TaxID=172846 RepID=A0AAV4XEY1_CAEEX|nr:hypothetical protein CEXT_354511 [Caerostris extrusa]